MAKPDLSDLDAFMAVAAARSFRAAAKVHGGSASSLGDAVRRLEKQLSVRLLNRTTRSVTPTEAGARLMEGLAPALGEITGALQTGSIDIATARPASYGLMFRLSSPCMFCRTSHSNS